MTSYLLFMLLLVEVLVLNVTAQEHDQIVAKDGCQSQCGNVTIPFPFGIGKEDCYLDYKFEISCYNNTPVLRNVGHLEVLEISIKNHTMRVSHPVFSTCENLDRISNETVDLRGTPFFFSPEENMFTGLGCRNLVYMTYVDPILDENYYLGGCFSICDKKRSHPTRRHGQDTCSGIKCCQTRILSSFQLFNMTIGYNSGFYKEDSETASTLQDCRHAFLVEQNWFLDHQDKVPNMEKVPVVLDWRVYESSVSNMSTYEDGGVAYNYCKPSSFYQNYSYCRCFDGYGGNPYLKDGCSDIDECKANKDICPNKTNCINGEGYYYCYHPNDNKAKIKTIMLGVGTSLAGLFLLVVAWRLSIIMNRMKDMKRKKEFFKRNGGLLLQQHLTTFNVDRVDICKLFSSEDLDRATDHFNVNRVLGQGGQGTVYKGMLADGRIVAVKKSKLIDECKLDEFVNEVVIVSQINHRNIVKLLGCCLETDVPLLVYEFIPNGTLFMYIQNPNKELEFTWDMRLRIATEVAEALSYLHSAASIPIYHRDIKSTNILLDEMLRAKVADFGTSKSLTIDQTHVTTKVIGTVGYIDPEYLQSNQFTEKSDVYSFGVVLVELLTGETPMRQGKCGNLVSYFTVSMKEDHLFEILDAQVQSSGKKEEIMTVASLAQRCLNLNGKKRPSMKEVAMVLEKTRASQKGSKLDDEHHCEEIECVRSEITESWDVVPSSTSSTFAMSVHPQMINH